MTWGKISGDLAFHAKVTAAQAQSGSNDAIGTWARALSWASENLSNGVVPEHMWALIGGRSWRKALTTLEEVGLVDRCAEGWEIHDFLEHNPSRNAVRLRREKRNELRGQELNNAVKRRDRGRCRYCRRKTKPNDKRSAEGFTYDHVNPGLAEGIDNLVVACRACNRKKGKRTPEQAGMPLLPEWAPDEVFDDDLDLALGGGLKSEPSAKSVPDSNADLSPGDLPGTYHRDGTGYKNESGQVGSGSGPSGAVVPFRAKQGSPAGGPPLEAG